MDPEQALTTASIGDRIVPESQTEQLVSRYVPILAVRERGDRGIGFDLTPI
jgi:hypothetical protein